MASKFKILVSQKKHDLHLKLIGDFDGSSAYKLIHFLEMCNGIPKVFINTSGLKHIYPFGRDTFHSNLYNQQSQPPRLIFTGKHSGQLSPERMS